MVVFRSSGLISYYAGSGGLTAPTRVLRETGPADAPKPRLLDRVRAALRARHYSRRTEDAYVAWIRRYIIFHGKRHPVEMSAAEVTRFLSSLAVEGKVAASTQLLPVVLTFAVALTIPRSQRLQALILRRGRHVG